MPRIDRNAYETAEEKQGGGFAQPQPGAYVLQIQAVRTEWDENDFSTGLKVHKTADSDSSVLFIYDIAEGEFAGEYSRDFFMDGGKLDERKDWMHQTKYGWWDMGRLKLFNNVLKAWNPGFDALAALEADQWSMFVGKKFGAVLNGTVTTNDRGYDNWKLRCGDWITPDEMKSGDHKEPKVTDRRKAQTAKSTDAGSIYDDDIPFM